MLHSIDWSKSHCGVYLTDYKKTLELMPEVQPVLDELSNANGGEIFWDDKLVDVKVHMLMPKQFPCIPDWHYDFRPRSPDGIRVENNDVKVGTGEKLYSWISGPPFTEYLDDEGELQRATPNEWHDFTQDDIHRGAASTNHCWRCFIRVIPRHLAHQAMQSNIGGLRRHAQVYLDATDYSW